VAVGLTAHRYGDIMAKKQKLELTWIGKESCPKLEPRILVENPELSYHAKHKVSENDIFDNMLIHGDNLLALKSLEQEYAGKIKCIYIDPPYNTGSAFEHYDDGVEHSLWLTMMQSRLENLKNLLSENGSIWVSINDHEMPYLKVLMDMVFGRKNFVSTICWEMIYTKKNSAKYFSTMHEYVIVFAKNKDLFVVNQLTRSDAQNNNFKNPDNDPRGMWIDNAVHARNFYSKGSYIVTSPTGKEFSPPQGRYWAVSEDNFKKLDADNRIWWGASKSNAPRKKTFITEVKQGVVPGTIWRYNEVGSNAEAKNEIKQLFKDEGVFITPKPERLLERILHIATDPGDLVLDSFLGSGTTAAVAHKMGRKWISIELGEHCYTHCIPRLKQVIDGTDKGGVSTSSKTTAPVKLCKSCQSSLCEKCTEKVGKNNKGGELLWKGGGGFRFYELGPSLIAEDRWGNPVINPEFNPAMLAEAMCKLEGFTYEPSDEFYWMHGSSTETDFIYVTTQFLGRETLTKISDDVGPERSLLVCCTAFKCNPADFENLTIKKIPKAVLKKCEWGHDDYSLAIENLAEAPLEPEPQFQETKATPAKKFGKDKTQPSLLDFSDGGSK